MIFKFSTRWLIAGSILALIALIVIVNRTDEWLTTISYPLDTWRMDLDDVLANVGLFLVGVAAFVTLFRKADQAHKKADRVSKQVNGGMSKMAQEHVDGALKSADVELGLWRRVDALEKITEDCLEREKAWKKERETHLQDRIALRDWLNKRLDETGNGRGEPR